MLEQIKVAYDLHPWLRRACWAGLVVGAIILLWVSGGFPPLAWRLLARLIPELSYQLALHGPIILLSLVALVALSLTWLIVWGALLGTAIALVRHSRLSRREQQQFDRDLQQAQASMSWQPGASGWMPSHEHPTPVPETQEEEEEEVAPPVPPPWLKPLIANVHGEKKSGSLAGSNAPEEHPDEESAPYVQTAVSRQTGASAQMPSHERQATTLATQEEEEEEAPPVPPPWLKPLMADAHAERKSPSLPDSDAPEHPDEERPPLQFRSPTVQRDSPLGRNTSLHLEFGTCWDRGITRKDAPNEDSLVALQGNCMHNEQLQPFGLFVVADGMGGHANGQEASRIAIEAISDVVLPAVLHTAEREERYGDLLVEGANEANLALYQYNQQQGPAAFMGTTLTAALVIGSTAYIVNVGDSRTYLYRRAEGLNQITRDHSVVARLVEQKVISPHDIYTHPKRNEIYRCLGELASVQADAFTVPMQEDDMLLLCSDGLWEMVRDPDIERIMEHPLSEPAQMCKALVEAALEGGGKDNISAIVVRVHQ